MPLRVLASGAARLRWLAIAAVGAHLASRAWFIHEGRFFACEDDAYRMYLAYLIERGGPVVGKIWLPGQMVAMAAFQRLGIPAAWSGAVTVTLALVVLGIAFADVTRSLAPAELRDGAPWAAVLLVASSPLTLAMGSSSLAEPLASALLMVTASAVLRRARGAPRWVLGAGVLAALAATWVRYEAWALVLALPGVLYLLRRRAGGGTVEAACEAAIGALIALGPLAWCWRQAVDYKDPFGFLERVDDLSTAYSEPSVLRVLGHRLEALARWAPAVLVWAVVAVAALRARRETTYAALAFAVVAALGVAMEVAGGREHGVFTARLAYGIEVALWPLAAIGVAWAFASPRAPAVVAAVGTVAVLSAALLRPPEIVDPASVRVGLRLRRAELSPGAGALLVERVPRRPKLGWGVPDERARVVPFGWAAVGVLWGQWARTVWGARSAGGWELVEPTDPRGGRSSAAPADLGAWMERRGVTAAWILSPEWVAEVKAAWPYARVVWEDDGVLLARE
jgi:hypothetical protein